MSELAQITAEEPGEAPAVEALIDLAFGPGRFAKTAERLREGNHRLPDLSVVARDGGAIVGCARMWPIHIGERPAVLLGPFAVAPEWRNRRLGAALVEDACRRAREAGHALVLLVGDAPYFAKTGFVQVDPAKVAMPGPVDMRRVLVRALKPGATDGLEGLVSI